jgi:hypothetical protein
VMAREHVEPSSEVRMTRDDPSLSSVQRKRIFLAGEIRVCGVQIDGFWLFRCLKY